MTIVRITTSIDIKYHQIAKKHKIAWAEALKCGVLTLLEQYRGLSDLEPQHHKIEKLEKALIMMQNTINDLNRDLEKKDELLKKSVAGEDQYDV